MSSANASDNARAIVTARISGRGTAHSLRAVRTIRRGRAEGGSHGDLAYAIYAGALLVLIVGFPILRAIVLSLAEPTASAVLIEVGPQVSATVFALACAGLIALGGVRGPAMLAPFLMFAVAGSGHPRRRTLRRPTVTAVVSLAALGAGFALLPALVIVIIGDASVGAMVAFSGAGALAGLVCAGCWLLGQRLAAGVRAAAVGGVLLTLGVWVAAPWMTVTPWGWIASVFPGDGFSVEQGGSDGGAVVLAFVGLGLFAALAVAIMPVLLDGLRGTELLAQAQRWQTAGTLAFTGDLSMAMGEFRAVPRGGRGLRAIGGGGLARMFLRRDLVGSLRTPVRFALAVAGCLGCGTLVAVAVGASGLGISGPGVSGPGVAGPGVWLAASGAAIVGYLALGVWSDGFRHVAEVATAPPLYGVSTLRLLGLHALLPAIGGVVFVVLGVVVAQMLGIANALSAAASVGAGVGAGFAWHALAVAALSALLLVLVRIYDSAKGPLPLELMAPIPTPAGDASALVVAAWQADAVIIACTVVGVSAVSVAALGVGGVVIAVVMGLGLAYLTKRRVHAG